MGVRLSEEIRHDCSGKFITLSFSNESLYNIENGIGLDGVVREKDKIVGLDGYELDNEIAKKAVRKFLTI